MTTDLTPEELAGLRERAETTREHVPGPWFVQPVMRPDGNGNMTRPTNLAWVSTDPKGGYLTVCGDAWDGTAMHIAGLDPETVLRLVAMAERTQAVMTDLETATQQAFREQERGARYREALARIERGWHTNAGTAAYRQGYYTAIGIAQDIARAALAEPEEAQHGDD